MRLLPAAFAGLLIVGACTHDRKVDVARSLNPAGMPTMRTENVSTLISDSGITQYKIVTPLWLVFDEVDTPYWRFPKGIYLQKFDRSFRVIATVAADSARYFKAERLWRLDGNVEMHKAPADLFLSQQIYWDERQSEIYTDSFIHIENATHVLEGHGMISNDRLTAYRIIRPTGIFPIEEDRRERNAQAAAAPAPPGTSAARTVSPTPASAPPAVAAPPPGSGLSIPDSILKKTV